MWLHRPLMIRKSIGLRFLSHTASEALVEEPAPPFTYQDFPRPEPKYAETILAIPRSKSGKNISAKEREAGRVPSIVFEQLNGEEGGNKRLISVQTKQIRKLVNHLGYSFFLSRLFDLEIRSDFDSSDEIIERVHVLPRKVQCYSLRKEENFELVFSLLCEKSFPMEGGGKTHDTIEKKSLLRWNSNNAQTHPRVFIDLSLFPAIARRRRHINMRGLVVFLRPGLHLHSGTDAVLNVTFLRSPSHACLKVDVPLLFRGEDVCPGLRKGAYLNTIKRTVKYLCPADIVPPYIDVDLSELDVGQKLVMGDLKVHPALRLLQSAQQPVCKIMGSRVSQEQRKSK